MTVQTFGPLKVAMFIDESDMHTYGIGIDGINPDLARSLVTDAFLRSGVSPGNKIEIEAFTGKKGIMVFAEVMDEDEPEAAPYQEDDPRLYIFENLEDLVQVARNLTAPYPDAGLVHYERKYYLNISGRSLNESLTRIITEYGTEIEWNMLFFTHIFEHGQSISKNRIFDKLSLIV